MFEVSKNIKYYNCDKLTYYYDSKTNVYSYSQENQIHNMLYNLFQTRYGAFDNRNLSNIYKEPNSLLIYKPIANDFIYRYVISYLVSDIINESKNMFIVNIGVNQEETIMYYNSVRNKNDVNYYVCYTSLANKNIETIMETLKNVYVKKLMDMYSNVNPIYSIKLDKDYENIIDSLAHKNIDCVFFVVSLVIQSAPANVTYNNLVNLIILYTLIVIYMSSKLLVPNGSLVFKVIVDNLKVFEQLVSIVSGLFDTINIRHDKVKKPRTYLVVCKGFKKNDNITNVISNIIQNIIDMDFYSNTRICLTSVADVVPEISLQSIKDINTTSIKRVELLPVNIFSHDNLSQEINEYLHKKYEIDFIKAITYGISIGLQFNNDTIHRIQNYKSKIHELYHFTIPKKYILPISDTILKLQFGLDKNILSKLNNLHKLTIVVKIGFESLNVEKWNKINQIFEIKPNMNSIREILHVYDINNMSNIFCVCSNIDSIPYEHYNQSIKNITNVNTIMNLYKNHNNKYDLCIADYHIQYRYFEYEHREILASKIYCCQALAGIITTKLSGNFIFKILLPITTSLLLLLANYYKEVSLYRPIVTPHTSYETYVVCKNKHKILNIGDLKILIEIFITNHNTSIYLYENMTEYINKLSHATDKIIHTVVNNILSLYEAYDNPKSLEIDLKDNIKIGKDTFAKNWHEYIKN
jgi:hypothetical protein